MTKEFNDNTLIDVFNFSNSTVCVVTHLNPKGHQFEPAMTDNPFSIQMYFSEIRNINNQSNIFREGFLRFSKEKEKDVYEKLGISDWQNILKDTDIEDIILNPTKEGIERLLAIRSTSLFERVRGILIQLDNSGRHDISGRVKNAIQIRYKEIYQGKLQTEIIVAKTDAENEIERIENERAAATARIREEVEAKIRAEYEEKYGKEKAKSKKAVDKAENTTTPVSE
ncbi:hypothetical protein H6F38_23120 [Paenibacillus sp. EKM208P]|nr:hypothetical protein H6F38_23120 [Paenibacillus sp. EKM208P]